MSHYEQRYNNHQVHKTLESLSNSIDKNPSDLPKTGPERDTFERLKRVIAYTRATLDVIDRNLVTQEGLDNLNTYLTKINSSFANFRSNKNWNDLSNHCDTLLNHFYFLPRRDPAQAEKEFANAISKFRTDSDSALNRFADSQTVLETEFKSAKEKIAGLESAIQKQSAKFETQKGRLDQLITEEQSRFSQAEQTRLNEHTAKQDERKSEFDTLIEEKKEEFDKELSTLKTKSTEHETQLGEKAKSLVQTLEDHRDRAKEIVGLIGNTGMTGHFQKVANREWWSAEILRGIAIVFMGFMVLLVWMVVKDINADDFNWEVALFRVAVALALVWPAWFCGRESSRHRELESRNRRIELELASIGPYLERLDEGKAKEIIEKLADRYFGQSDSKTVNALTLDSIDQKQLTELRQLLNTILKLTGK